MKIALLGECMVELSCQEQNLYQLSFGGDTLNTAVYIVRNGGEADYFTVLGDDKYSHFMMTEWQKEGVGTEQVKIKQNAMPGLYIIETDDKGERSFNYWRDHAAAKSLVADYPEIFDSLMEYSHIFVSGITLSLYSDADRKLLFSFFQQFRQQGGVVVFDNNYRERNWCSKSQAINVFDQMMSCTDIALISYDDEVALYGAHTVGECMTRWVKYGIAEVVIKNGEHGCLVYEQGQSRNIPLGRVLKPVDTTAAGDSFNGAYLAAKLAKKSVDDCVNAGQLCAGNVIMHKGAIIDKSVNLQQEAV